MSTKYRVILLYVPRILSIGTISTTYEGYITKYNYETHDWDIVFHTVSDFKLPLLFTLWRMMKKVKKIDKLNRQLEQM